MTQFRFRLSPLQKYREHRRDLCRQALAQALAADAQLVLDREQIMASREKVLQEIARLQQGQRMNVEQAAARRYHAGQLQMQARQIDADRELLAQRIQLCRLALATADQEVKVLENLSDRQRMEFEKIQESKEAREVEEVWQAGQLSKRA